MINEELLRLAAADADRAILDSLPPAPACEHRFSRRFEHRMDRLLARPRPVPARRFLSRAACLAAAVMLSGGVWLAADLEARADFFAWIREKTSAYTAYRFTGQPDGSAAAEEYRPAWLPEGFTLEREETMTGSAFCLYSRDDGQRIVFQCSQGADATALFVLNEGEPARAVSVGELTGDFYQAAQPDEASLLAWLSGDGETLFSLTACLPEETLIRIAESVGPAALAE